MNKYNNISLPYRSERFDGYVKNIKGAVEFNKGT